jgi:hypothetical protein
MNPLFNYRCSLAVALLVTSQVGCGTAPGASPASAVPAAAPGGSSALPDSQPRATEPAALSRDFDFNI